MSKDLIALTDKERGFIEMLLENGGNVSRAASESGYHPNYAYKLRDRLAKAITQAAQEYLAVNSLKAATKIVETMDGDVPANALHLQAAQTILDRVGIIKKDPYAEAIQAPVIKANIFILPEKRYNEVLEVAYETAES